MTRPPAPDDPVASGEWPYSARSHDVGWAWMFDLAVVGSLLECRPGDTVLDLGCGTGFATEQLVRMGYRVISLDPFQEALGHLGRRMTLDPRLPPGRVLPVRALAQGLPLADGSIQGAIGMNMLHHVDDLEGALAELARVLEPGGRAAFSEPGLRHLENPHTQRIMRELGEDDKPLDVRQLGELGRKVGLPRLELVPVPIPQLARIEIRDLDLYADGAHWVPWTKPGVMADYVVEYHPLFALVKDGERPRTSRRPGVLAVDLEVGEVPAEVRPGETFAVPVTLRNTGDCTWLAGPLPHGGFVTLGGKLLRANGRVVTDHMARTRLPRDVAPGEVLELVAETAVPEDVQPGDYRLEFDLVDEWIRWFGDSVPGEPVTFPLRVLAGAPGPGENQGRA